MEQPKGAPKSPEQKSMTDSLMDADPLRSLFGLDKVKDLRDKQREAHDKALQIGQEQGYSPELSAYYAGAAVADQISSYLETSGFSSDDPIRAQATAGLMGVSILEVPESEWSAKQDENGGPMGQSGRDKTIATYEEISGKPYDQMPEHVFSEEDQEVLDTMHTELDGLRDNLATLSAKRQGRVFGKGGEAYQEALSAYNTHLVALGELENAPLIEDESIDEETKKAKIVKYLFDEQAKLRQETNEKLKGTKVGKVVEWLTSGTRSQRILKGIAVGAGAAVVAGAVAAGAGVLGVAGAAAIGAGAGVALRGGVRFARGFATADSKAGRGMATEADGVKVLEGVKDIPDAEEPNYVQRISDLFGQQLEEDTQKEQLKRRKSVAKGLGAVAIGAVVGTAGGILIGEIASHGADFNPFSGHIGNHAATLDHGHAGPPTTHDGAGDTVGHPSADAMEAQAQQAAHEAAEKAAEQAANTPDPNFYVQPGEGGIQLFNHMGLSESQWYQVQENLLQKFPQDFYQNPGQAVRLSHSGQLSIEAQKFIKSSFGMP